MCRCCACSRVMCITLFNGGPEVPGSSGGEFEATVTQMGRSHVQVQVGAHMTVEREAATQVHLARGHAGQ